MLKQAKFKVELEVVVEVDIPEGVASVPYTRMGAVVNEEFGTANIYSSTGTIKKADIKKLERTDD